jgi:hypothetical protein
MQSFISRIVNLGSVLGTGVWMPKMPGRVSMVVNRRLRRKTKIPAPQRGSLARYPGSLLTLQFLNYFDTKRSYTNWSLSAVALTSGSL